MTMQQDRAETIAAQALEWLAGHERLLPVFLNATGARPDDFRRAADNPDFLASVLDFITMDDAWVVDFCDAMGLPPGDPYEARQALPGGYPVHWT